MRVQGSGRAAVLVIGGYGGFGARLCRRLAAMGLTVIVAGRSQVRAAACARGLPCARGVALDSAAPDLAQRIADSGARLVIDASGPFQGAPPRVARAAIAAGIPYLDLADAGDFIARVAALDAEARASGVTLLSGASSVPALSGAAARALAEGMERLVSVDILISASNRGGAGASVARAMLAGAGRPFDAREAGRTVQRRGWTGLSRRTIRAGTRTLGGRWFADVAVPDVALLPPRLPGNPSVRFRAGTDRAVQILGLRLVAGLVRLRLLRSGERLAWLLRPLQRLTGMGASRWSGMEVRVVGMRGSAGIERRWSLLVGDGRGPEVPTLAAALLAEKLLMGGVPPGARDAGEALALGEFDAAFSGLPAHSRIEEASLPPPLYRRLLGPRFDALPPAVRAMHDVVGTGAAAGEFLVTRGRNPLARAVAALMRFPPAGTHRVHVTFESSAASERWSRDFGGCRFASRLSQAGDRLVERFGPLRFHFDLGANAAGLDMLLRRWTCLGVPLPLALAPRIEASEREDAGRFAVDVAIALPLLGPVVRYRGNLTRIA